MKPEKLESFKSWLIKEIDEAKKARDDRLEKIEERNKIANPDAEYYNKLLPDMQESNIVDSSINQALSRREAAMAKIFFGGQDVGKIVGKRPEYDKNARNIQELITHWLMRKNNFFNVGCKWMRESDINLLGVLKETMHFEVEEVEERDVVDFQTLQIYEQNKVVEHAEIVPDAFPILYAVNIKYEKVTEKYVKVENLPPEEFIYTPNARSLEDVPLVGHIKETTIGELYKNVKKKLPSGQEVGIYSKSAIDRIASEGASGVPEQTNIETERTNDEYDEDDRPIGDINRKVEIVECYCSYDLNGDKEAEPLIATVCGKEFIRMPEENKEKDHPFVILPNNFDPHRLWPKYGWIDKAAPWQHLLTAMERQLAYAIAVSNKPQAIVDSRAVDDIDQLVDDNSVILANVQGQGLRVSDIIQWRPSPNIAQWTFNLMEMARGKLEEITGITRYNQGLDASSLNKTATGIQTIVSQSNQELEKQARLYAETGFKRAIERAIFLIQFYQAADDVYQLTGSQYDYTANDIAGEFAYETDIGVGAGTREQNVQLLQMLSGEAPILVQVGLMDLQGAYNLVKKKYEEMGLKNIDQYLINPEEKMQEMMASGQVAPGVPGPGMPGVPTGQVPINAPGNMAANAGGGAGQTGILPA
jgi:hypothetical protein